MSANFTHDIVERAAALFSPAFLHSLSRTRVLLPYYHLVTDGAAPHVRHLYRFRAVKEFEADLEFFLHHFEPIRLEDLLNALDGRSRLPQRAFLLSFDDGFREMHDVVAPMLKARGVPAVFFLTSAMLDNRELCFHQKMSLLIEHRQIQGPRFPAAAVQRLLGSRGISGSDVAGALKLVPWSERTVLDEIAQICGCDFGAFLAGRRPYLDSDQVRSMLQQGFEIGAHSIDHPRYSDIPLQEQLRQTSESMTFLQERFALTRRPFAFPHSDAGVRQVFFDHAFSEGLLEVSFGTGGMLDDAHPRHFQRFSIEKTSGNARQEVAWHFARRLLRRGLGQAVVSHAN